MAAPRAKGVADDFLPRSRHRHLVGPAQVEADSSVVLFAGPFMPGGQFRGNPSTVGEQPRWATKPPECHGQRIGSVTRRLVSVYGHELVAYVTALAAVVPGSPRAGVAGGAGGGS